MKLNIKYEYIALLVLVSFITLRTSKAQVIDCSLIAQEDPQLLDSLSTLLNSFEDDILANVTDILCTNAGLTGEIPADLGKLTNLTNL